MRIILTLVFLVSQLTSGQVLKQRAVTLMGSRFDITIVANDGAAAEKYIDSVIAEITRIENLISEWRPQTQVSEINRNAGIKPVKVDAELIELTKRAIYFSELTDGAFDITFAAADKIWKFDGSMTALPSKETIKESIRKIGYKNIVIDEDNSTIFLKIPGMKIGFGATGKGYAADKAKVLMLSKGVSAGIINASGDMNTWGAQPNGKPWTVGITHPMKNDELLAVMPLNESAVVTSGSYEKFALINGKRYSHIINPKTGYPASGLSSVTVFGPSAETANGFSTAIMVLEKKGGKKLMRKFPEIKYIIVTDNGKVYYSHNKLKRQKLNYPFD